MEAAQLAGTLVKVEDVQRAAAQAGRICRDRLLSLPSRLAGDIACMDSAAAVYELLTTEIRSALEHLAEGLEAMEKAE